MCIWSIILIKSDLKWCIHLSRSLFIFCRLGGTVNSTLPFTANERISISTSQTFRSCQSSNIQSSPAYCVFISQLIQYARAPHMTVLYWRPSDSPVSYWNRNISWNAWNRHSGSFTVDTGIVFSNTLYEASLSRMLNGILIIDQLVTPIPIILFTNFMTLIPSLTFTKLRVVSMEHLQRVWHASREPFCGHLVPYFLDLLLLQLLRLIFPNLPCFSRFFTLNIPCYFLNFAY